MRNMSMNYGADARTSAIKLVNNALYEADVHLIGRDIVDAIIEAAVEETMQRLNRKKEEP